MIYSPAVATTLDDETLAERDNQAKTCNSENNSVVNPILELLMDHPTRIEIAVIDCNRTTTREGMQHIHTRFGDVCPAARS